MRAVYLQVGRHEPVVRRTGDHEMRTARQGAPVPTVVATARFAGDADYEPSTNTKPLRL
jgi:hypothetical protein